MKHIVATFYSVRIKLNFLQAFILNEIEKKSYRTNDVLVKNKNYER